MPPYLHPLRFYTIDHPLPPYCEPTTDFLYSLSSTLGTCVPTPLALVTSLLGTLSIISWLFAQLPQIYKNHKLQSTSGLSAVFLTEWLLGDLSNLLGSLFTRQATWQIIIACYYVFVDCALCGQWVWYELLKHGRPLRPILRVSKSSDGTGGRPAGNHSWDGTTVGSSASDHSAPKPTANDPGDKNDKLASSPIPRRTNPLDAFRFPSSPAKESWNGSPATASPTNKHIRRVAASSPPNMAASPRTILYISLILAVMTNTSLAKSISPFAPGPFPLTSTPKPTIPNNPSHLHLLTSSASFEIAGKVLSWLSTLLYLGSRLPQLYKNHSLKSTAGLSPTLFAAAFFGNLFYSTSLATNPCAWNDFPSGSGHGWVGPEGSVRSDWLSRAAPFFLGAAGVLFMDAAVGVQFLVYSSPPPHTSSPRGRPKTRLSSDVYIVGTNPDGSDRRRRFRWRRASGWMRGWYPSVSVAGTPTEGMSRAGTPALSPSASASASPRPGAIPIPVGGGSGNAALEEARALLGTQRHASPRSFGYGYGSVGG